MTFLPIVDRELRVTARRRSIYRVRLAVALTAMLLAGIILVVKLGAPQHQLGRHVFEGLSVLSFIYCLFSGRISTADSLSEEKRDGTLGLLFLTDLKGYDVVLGKLTATSVSSFYRLLAIFPVLAIPFLLGGVAAGEFRRMVLVLVNTLLFSLTAGMFVSAVSQNAQKALTAAFCLILFVAAGPPAIGLLVATSRATFSYPEGFLL